MKQIYILLIALLMGLSANAEKFGTCGPNLKWHLTDDGVLTITGEGRMDNYYDRGYYVGGPWGNNDIKRVIIGDSVTSIGSEAFRQCVSLTSVTIPNSVTTIGNSAFSECLSLTSVTIGNSVTTIGNRAFSGCGSLTSVTIPNSVTTIGETAFYYCSSLTSVTIGNSVTTIGNEAFTNNDAKIIWLTNTPPNGYSNVKGSIHYVANDLYTSLSYKKVYPYLSSIFEVDGIKYVPVSPSERTCDAIDCAYTGEPYEVKINKKVNYKGVDMTVREINLYTAYKCTNIKKAYIDINGSIGYRAFSDCVNLSAVDIAKVNDIGYNAFSGCTNLTSVGIKKANNIGNNAFSKCTNLVSVDIKAGNNIGESAFRDCISLITLSLDNKITSLGEDAFRGCINLTQFIIPDSVTILNYDLLRDCSSLKSIRIHKGIREMYHAFSGCTNLSTFIIEDRNTSLKVGSDYENVSLYSCKLDSVYIGGKIVYDTSRDDGYSPFYRNTSLRTVKISDAETTIYDNEFYGCTNLQNVSIGDNVKSIGKWAFSGCSSLKNFTFGSGLQSIGQEAFSDCSNLTQFVIPDSVTILNSGLLDGCSSLKSIRIHKGIREMYHAFSGCTNLSTLIIEDRNTSLKIVSDNNPLFKDCKLDSVYIGGKIVYDTSSDYGYSPFYHNTSLRTVKISDTETTIYDNEFYGCTNLQNVSIGDNVTSIGKWAFSGCSSLKNFIFGSGLQSIGQEAFSDCINITQISSKAVVPPTCGINALDDINKWNCKLFVPKANINAYKQAPQWKEFFFIEGTTGITNTVYNKAGLVDVYTIDGTKRLSKASTDEINALPKGVYIVNGKKIIIK